ncbi:MULTISPECIES: TetR/AcrR family transcriptional regulator [unclassified Brevibacterium]|uniref:TetR/AcrR family transcriptional regulator n=1 Tax=unclassified Brevibacterium TaxID=2614124 RepID=UPI0010929780|nr:TetR/AcrR family transcriptional regulator [Brevibacterium sp. S22]TGD32301.1 TetR/AcrR family transcriptional regulator [Brevibacterium sp. S22]
MKSITDGRSTRWQKHRDERRRELLRTVRHVVAEHGDDMSMDQISEASGTTKSVLYRYFTDRAGLQAAMGEWAMGVIVRSLDEAAAASAKVNGTPDGEESLAAMIRAFVTLAANSPNVYRFCDTAVNRFAPEETGGFFNSIAGLLAERLDLADDRDRLWSAGAIGFVRAATEAWLSNPSRVEEFASDISNWLWASLPANLGVEQ